MLSNSAEFPTEASHLPIVVAEMAEKPISFGEQSHRAPHPSRAFQLGSADADDAVMSSGVSLDISDDEPASSLADEEVSITESIGSTALESQVKDEPVDSSNPGTSAGEGFSLPAQKRRRVTRACDECRRKKIKCDGQQPCTHCSVYSYECTYDKPSNRRRNPAPQYIEALENRLQRAEALLRKFMPDADLADPNLDPAVQQEFRNRERARTQIVTPKDEGPQQAGDQDTKIMTMIQSIGQLDLSEGGEWDFHGTSSGAVFLRRMKEHLRGLLGSDYHTPFLPRPPRPPGMFSLDSPRSSSSPPWDLAPLPNIYDLPPKEKARTLCYYSLNCATCLLRIVHIPTFYEMFDRVYELPPERFGTEETRFLGLLYSVLALGSMYDVSALDSSGSANYNYKAAMDQGLKYYASARLLLQDVAECRELTSLQALLFMLLFLQVTSGISGCYSFLGIALRSAIRIGLHRHIRHVKITPIEDETRRRCFYVIRQMDTHISAILGFPMILNQEDIDQRLPTEVDDQYITKDAIIQPPADTPSFFQAFNAHERLMRILAKVVRYIYPPKGAESDGSGGGTVGDSKTTYSVEYAKIREIEQDLQNWYEQLPIHWRPSPDGPTEVLRVRTLLRFSYAHVQMMLYRPFLHHASPRLSVGKKVDKRYYACAAAGISVSQNIVHIGTEIMKQAVLIGPYWLILYTEFFAILSLVFYVLENPDERGSAEMLADARAGRDVIAGLAQRSVAAERVTNTLNTLFEQLPSKLKKAKGRIAPTRKRSAPGPKSGSVPARAPASLESGKLHRRSEELSRQPSGSIGDGRPKIPPHEGSFDATGLPHGLRNQEPSPAALREILPFEIPTPVEMPDGVARTGSVHSQTPSYHPGYTPGGSSKPFYGFDDMIFSSDDPFAYPHQQPLIDFASQAQGRQPMMPGGSQPPSESLQFYIPNVCDIDGDLIGQLPPYLLQQEAGQSTPGLANQIFDTSNMAPTQQPRPAHAQYLIHHHNQQQQQRHQREIEDMLNDPNFRGDWGSILGNGSYR